MDQRSDIRNQRSINVFGLKSTGEKLVFLLDTNNGMLVDEVGGIPAYTIIKKELLDRS